MAAISRLLTFVPALACAATGGFFVWRLLYEGTPETGVLAGVLVAAVFVLELYKPLAFERALLPGTPLHWRVLALLLAVTGVAASLAAAVSLHGNARARSLETAAERQKLQRQLESVDARLAEYDDNKFLSFAQTVCRTGKARARETCTREQIESARNERAKLHEERARAAAELTRLQQAEGVLHSTASDAGAAVLNRILMFSGAAPLAQTEAAAFLPLPFVFLVEIAALVLPGLYTVRRNSVSKQDERSLQRTRNQQKLAEKRTKVARDAQQHAAPPLHVQNTSDGNTTTCTGALTLDLSKPVQPVATVAAVCDSELREFLEGLRAPDQASVRFSALLAYYERSGGRRGSKTLAQALAAAGFRRIRRSDGIWWAGLALPPVGVTTQRLRRLRRVK